MGLNDKTYKEKTSRLIVEDAMQVRLGVSTMLFFNQIIISSLLVNVEIKFIINF